MSLKEQLISAINSRDNEKVSDVLEQMSVEEVNEKDEYGQTALHKGCWWENNLAVSLLLAKPGINVNVKNIDGRTPLHVACLCNKDWAVDQLLRFPGIHENAKDNYEGTPIMHAARRCNEEALAVMLKSPRVDLDVKDDEGKGLEESVGICYRNKEKTKCLDMIREERIRRKTALGNEKQENGEKSLKIDIEKIERIDKEIKDCEQRWKEKVDSRKLKRRELDQKQKNEKRALEESFDKDDEETERYIASLKEIRKDLTKDIEKMSINSSNDDGAKLEAARDTLECPVCFEITKPPTRIWMCRSSHVICETCKDHLVRDNGGPHPPCPTCKSERVDQRALIVEKMAASLFNP